MSSGELWLEYGGDVASGVEYWLLVAMFVGLMAVSLWLSIAHPELFNQSKDPRDSWPYK